MASSHFWPIQKCFAMVSATLFKVLTISLTTLGSYWRNTLMRVRLIPLLGLSGRIKRGGESYTLDY